jgi:hypothetical protein
MTVKLLLVYGFIFQFQFKKWKRVSIKFTFVCQWDSTGTKNVSLTGKDAQRAKYTVLLDRIINVEHDLQMQYCFVINFKRTQNTLVRYGIII